MDSSSTIPPFPFLWCLSANSIKLLFIPSSRLFLKEKEAGTGIQISLLGALPEPITFTLLLLLLFCCVMGRELPRHANPCRHGGCSRDLQPNCSLRSPALLCNAELHPAQDFGSEKASLSSPALMGRFAGGRAAAAATASCGCVSFCQAQML